MPPGDARVIRPAIPDGYKIVADSARVLRGWRDLEDRVPEDIARVAARLSLAPLERYPRRQFPLKYGSFRHIWEYEVNRADRIFYRVDVGERAVVILYAGPHADAMEVLK